MLKVQASAFKNVRASTFKAKLLMEGRNDGSIHKSHKSVRFPEKYADKLVQPKIDPIPKNKHRKTTKDGMNELDPRRQAAMDQHLMPRLRLSLLVAQQGELLPP